jgi:hypothetical protein
VEWASDSIAEASAPVGRDLDFIALGRPCHPRNRRRIAEASGACRLLADRKGKKAQRQEFASPDETTEPQLRVRDRSLTDLPRLIARRRGMVATTGKRAMSRRLAERNP